MGTSISLADFNTVLGNIKGQEHDRFVDHFLDQHGREYVANCEKKTADPCEVIQPVGWKAPLGPEWFVGLLTPPEPYRKIVPRHMRAKKRYQVEIDYAAWLRDWDEREESHRLRLHNLAQGMGSGMEVIKLIENPPPALAQHIGPGPFPPRAFIEAAAAGNEWALGLTDVVPKKARAILDMLEPMLRSQRIARRDAGAVDPLSDDADEEFRAEVVADIARDHDPLNDLDEAFGEQPPRRGKGKK